MEEDIDAILEALRVDLAGLELEWCLMNAAGTCKELEGEMSVKSLVRTATAAVMVGSITSHERGAGQGDIYYSDKQFFSINKMGLPNPGRDYYEEHLAEMVSICHQNKKPLFLSVVGFGLPEEWADLTEFAFSKKADLVELNISCPNLFRPLGQGDFRSLVCYDLALTEEILERVQARVGKDAKLAVKIAYFPDFLTLKKIIEIIEKFQAVKAITTMNTLPNALALDEKLRLRISDWHGGLGGPAIKQVSLGQVALIRSMLRREDMKIIGVGGIRKGSDIVEYEFIGADAGQIASVLLDERERAFDRILSEYVAARGQE